jgi:retron-type reverse transcriptase
VHEQDPGTVATELLKSVWSLHSLERAWRVIEENARTSQSEDVKREINVFREEAPRRLRSLSSKLSRGSFQFPPAKGIPIPKRGKGGKISNDNFRPIVLANVESRIVQRSILDVLLQLSALQKYVHTPHSFGGSGKDRKQTSLPFLLPSNLSFNALLREQTS